MKILLLLITLASSCYGRIGETFQECVERYGEPTKESARTTTFEKNRITITVTFFGAEKKVGYLVYLASSDKLGTEEVKRLIKLNAPDKTWGPVMEAIEHFPMLKSFESQTLDGGLHAEGLSVVLAPRQDNYTIVGVSSRVYRDWKAKQKPEDPLNGF